MNQVTASAARPLRVYIDNASWFIRKTSTDWRYLRRLSRMERFVPLTMVYSGEVRHAIEENLRWAKRVVRTRLGLSYTPEIPYRFLPASLVDAARADVVFTHGAFPLTRSAVPIAWLYGVVDPVMRAHFGVPAADIEREYSQIALGIERSAALVLPTLAMVERHAWRFPRLADRFRYVPFFHDGIVPLADERVVAKQRDTGNGLTVAFVGRGARQKGLDIVIDALRALADDCATPLTLVAVTPDHGFASFTYKRLTVRVHGELPHVGVVELMRSAHIYAMPSHSESYGFVYVEAMASGCALVVPCWENQSELIGHGAAGHAVFPAVPAVAAALRALLDDGHRGACALNAVRRYRSHYAGDAVAALHHRVLSNLGR